MSRHPGIGPFLPVPRDERHRLMTVANLALLELHGGQAGPAQADLQAVAVVVTELLQTYHVEDGHQAVLHAAGALESVRQGNGSHADAAAACRPLVEVFAALLIVTTLRRLEAAKAAARLAEAATCP